jgi:hypothetical protein
VKRDTRLGGNGGLGNKGKRKRLGLVATCWDRREIPVRTPFGMTGWVGGWLGHGLVEIPGFARHDECNGALVVARQDNWDLGMFARVGWGLLDWQSGFSRSEDRPYLG